MTRGRPSTRWAGRLTVTCLLAALVGVLAHPGPARADQTRDEQWHLAFLHVDQAHRYSQGDGVTVGVVDSGVQADHPDLVANVLPGADFTDAGGDGRTDPNGHGTRMAGLIAAHGHDHDAGALGIAPRARILPVTDGVISSTSRTASSIHWAVDHGARVVCFAGGFAVDDEVLRQAIAYAFAHDVVVVAGVGNAPKATDVEFPARYEGVVAAAGVDRNGDHAAVSVTGSAVVLSAPAVDIMSTAPNNRYSLGVGTSDATAIIAGAAALVRARFPELSATEVVHRLTATAIDKGPPGRDDQYGYGIVNLVGALTADVPPLRASPSAQPTTSAHAAPSRRSNAALPVAAVVAVLVAAGGVLVLRARRR